MSHSWAAGWDFSSWEVCVGAYTSAICIRFLFICSVSLHKHWNDGFILLPATLEEMFMEMACWSRPSVFHQQLFAVIIQQCWCQTCLAWRGEANAPPEWTREGRWGGKNVIHLKCGAVGLGSERASVQRAPLKEHYVRSERGWWRFNHNTITGFMNTS